MRILRTVVAMGWAALSSLAAAQVPTEQLAGLRDGTPRWHALTGVTLVAAPGREVPKATVVMRDGLIVAAGAGVPVPAGARVWPLDGRRVYAGFIDLVSSFGVPAALQAPPPVRPRFGLGAELPPPAGPRAEPRPLAARGLAAGSPMLRAEQDVAAQLEWRPETARSLRELGFTAVLATPATGVWRGQGALLALGVAEPGNARAQVMAPRVTQHLAFDATRRAELVYPSSQMGAVAMARQALHDARWYRAITTAGGERVEPNDTLAALGGVLDGSQPVVAVADDEQDYERIARLRDEFKLTRLFVEGNGYEYRRAAQIRALGLAVVAPLDFPAAPDVQDADSALDVPLDTLQHWEQAPSGPALLHRAGVPLALTTAGLRDAPGEFWARVRLAVQRGWPADAALAALTTQPAALLGQAARLGTVEPGRIAHLVVTRGDPFVDDEAVVEMVFVDGRPLRSDVSDRGDPRGEWAVDGDTAVFNVAGTRRAPRVEGAPSQARCPVVPNGREWQLRIPCNAPEAAAIVAALQGDDRLVGSRQQPDGTWQPWSATRRSAFVPPAKPAPQTVPAPPAAVYPAGMYGVPMPARPAVLLVRNATLWTQGPAGRIDGADLLVRDGRIAAVGRSLNAPDGAEVIDAAGRHVTPGLIDAHSHIAVRGGVNEFTASNTAEVRIIDALDATDINIYRQLAGGLTASNVLHGSANTIGGQSQVIKLRWGADAGGLVFEGAKPSIKFALGENPRSVNFRNAGRDRYPTTRMGVEQVLRDSFAAAREYAAAHRAWRDAPRGRPEPRRDLRLEALAEVLERRRAIHVHSYRADEILMFARFARDNGLEVAAFQHVLEGYKAAQAIASIGAGASTFSDWWGFKMEVQDAVPDNAAMLHRAGVLTTMNSDDPELGRRMNTEAAKAMRHGGLSEQEALSLVTLNAARQLGVGHRTGSLEVGKDADFVIWSGPPLSTSSRAEQTWVDGRRHFDVATDRQLRVQGEAERRRLVAAVAAFTAAQGARRPGASADAPADLPIPPSSLSELALMRALQAARGQRSSYAGFDAPHECTTDGTHLHGVAP